MISIPNFNHEGAAIARAYAMLAREVGHVAAATAIYDQIIAHYGQVNAHRFLQMYGRAFPILSAVGEEDASYRVRKRVSDLNNQLLPILEGKTEIVCIGNEAAWLDIATPMHIDKTFHIIPHSFDADMDRILANYGENVRIHNSVDLTHLYGTASIIITFAFGVTDYNFFSYPVVSRVCGRDARQSFSELIALDIIESPLRYCPKDLVEMDCDEMTHVFSRRQKSIRRQVKWNLLTS